MSDSSRASGGDIHRLLDRAFAGIELTPDAQDLKEEIRGNLLARVAELEAAGHSPAEAAREAMDELGDVRELVGADTEPSPAGPGGHVNGGQAAYLRNRVRPEPAFVVRTVLLSIVAAAALVLFVLGITGVLTVGSAGLLGLGAAVAVPIGVVTADALRQETTSNYPLPPARAAGFGVAAFAMLAALVFGATFAVHLDQVWLVIAAGLPFVTSIVLFSWLGVTKTNRHKAWLREAYPATTSNRFEEEPEAAARFGLYTVVIWLVALTVAVVLGFTVGWWWAPLALVAGVVAMMLVLARMLFGQRKT